MSTCTALPRMPLRRDDSVAAAAAAAASRGRRLGRGPLRGCRSDWEEVFVGVLQLQQLRLDLIRALQRGAQHFLGLLTQYSMGEASRRAASERL